MPDFGRKQPLADNSQVMMDNSQTRGIANGFQTPEQGLRPVSSAATAPLNTPALVRSEFLAFMPMFVESAIKTILPKIESSVNRTVSGAMSSLLQSSITSLVQSAVNSAGKKTSLDPASTSQTGRIICKCAYAFPKKMQFYGCRNDKCLCSS